MSLVVNPNHRIQSKFAAIEPPLWAGLTADYYNADILDAEALDLTVDETVDRIRSYKTKDVLLVVMGNNPSVSSTPKMPVAEAIAEKIKDLNVTLTGIHPIAAGSKYPVLKEPFKGFPRMPWDRLPMDKYRAHNWHCLDGSPRSPYASIYTSLGCPFNCYYCNIHTLYDRNVQLRPVKDIVKDVDYLTYKYGVRNIKFWDELFALDEKRVVDICRELEPYDLNIWAYARVDTITKGMLRAMKRGGIKWLAYGFESADIAVRLKSGKKFKNGQVETAIKMTQDSGINIIGNFMFGLPGDTQESMRETLGFAIDHTFEYVNFYEAKPYPGSQWYKDINPSKDWKDYDQYGTNILPFRDMAFKFYFTQLKYIKSIHNKFGEQGVNQIREMLDSGRPTTERI
jgi:anaerobic magnesium-protoporphyrin IX monomethyl ester cyclase